MNRSFLHARSKHLFVVRKKWPYGTEKFPGLSRNRCSGFLSREVPDANLNPFLDKRLQNQTIILGFDATEHFCMSG